MGSGERGRKEKFLSTFVFFYPMVLLPGNIEVDRMDILPANNGSDSMILMGFFDNEPFMNAIEQDGNIEVSIGIKLLTGQWVYGNDTVKVK